MITKAYNQLLFAKIVAAFIHRHAAGRAVPDNFSRTECLVLWAICFGILEVVLDDENHICGVGIGRLFSGEAKEFDWQEYNQGNQIVIDVIVCTKAAGRIELIRRLYYRYPWVNGVFGFRKGKLVEYKQKHLKRLYRHGRNNY